MAQLDMSDGIIDPLFLSKFDVLRRAEVVGTNGRNVLTTTTLKDKVGVITVASSSDLKRYPDLQITNRSIVVVTKFALQGEIVGFQPDLVVWAGSHYLVRAIDPYPQYGSGFYQVIAESINFVDPKI